MKEEKVISILNSSLIFKISIKVDIPLENGLNIYIPSFAMSNERCFVTDYNSLIKFSTDEQLPDSSFFFVLNSPDCCSEISLPHGNSYFFLNIGMESFIYKFDKMFLDLQPKIRVKNYQSMQENWQKVITGNNKIECTEFFYSLKEFVACIVVEKYNSSSFQDSELSSLINDLDNFFIRTNIFPFKNQVIIMYSQKERPSTELSFSYSKFNDLLSIHNSLAGISNACRYTEMYGTLYHTSSTSLELSKKINTDKKYVNIAIYDEYATYYIIHLCVKEFIRIHGHTDIIYLISPSIIKLYRYDKKYNGDLLNTLFYYLLSGQSTIETAKKLFMHRNTVSNKLSKIHAIINTTFDDGNTQFKLLMSCFIVNYYKDYLEEKL